MNKRHHIVFYTKNGCPLCDEARETLHRLRSEFLVALEEIDITTDASLYERYKNIVPVIVIDGRHTLGARIEEEELRSCLEEAGK